MEAADTNNDMDVYVHDIKTKLTKRISITSAGEQRSTTSQDPAISSDGRYVTFETYGRFEDSDMNRDYDIYVRDLHAGTTKRVSIASNGQEISSMSYNAAISGNGRFIAFETSGSFEDEDKNSDNDIYVHDREIGETTRVSIKSSGEEVNTYSGNASISNDGRYVVFQTSGAFESDDTNIDSDIYVHDREFGTTKRISVTSMEEEIDVNSDNGVISGDGRFVVFDSPGAFEGFDTNGWPDIYIHDIHMGTTRLVSISPYDQQTPNGGSHPLISDDGRHVVFGDLPIFVRSFTDLSSRPLKKARHHYIRKSEASLSA